MIIKNKKFGIMGLARSGIASALKILEHGGHVFISEVKTEETVKNDIIKQYNEEIWLKLKPFSEFGIHTPKLLECDVLIISPGIPVSHPLIKKALENKKKVISEIEFGYLIKDKQSKIIAVTGSNGKSTTVSLIDHFLKNAGYQSLLAGNIGRSLTSFPIEKPGFDYLVLELSSYQLELTEHFLPETALLLNISEDHLERHTTIDNYTEAKLRIFMNQDNRHKAVLNADDKRIMNRADSIRSKKAYFGVSKAALPNNSEETALLTDNHIVLTKMIDGSLKDFSIDCVNSNLYGIHNRLNIMAAILAVSDIIPDIGIIEKSLKTFNPLPHRLEMIEEFNGIRFINDSKATNTEAVKYALTAFDKPLHVIMGGYEKGEDYKVLLPYLIKNVKGIYLIGNAKTTMALAFQSLNSKVSTHKTMLEAVKAAYDKAEKGDIVILSPACASFDMYKDFEHRGEVFRMIVKELIRK